MHVQTDEQIDPGVQEETQNTTSDESVAEENKSESSEVSEEDAKTDQESETQDSLADSPQSDHSESETSVSSTETETESVPSQPEAESSEVVEATSEPDIESSSDASNDPDSEPTESEPSTEASESTTASDKAEEATEAEVVQAATASEAEAANQDQEAPAKEKKSLEIAHIEADQISDGETVLAQIEKIIGDNAQSYQTLENVNAEQLINLIQFFYHQENIYESIPRVGVVKRSFDALREASQLPNETVDEFRQHLSEFNHKRNQIQQQHEKEKVDNAKQKRDLLVKLKEIVATEDPLKINEVREVQESWKSIGQVPKHDIEPLYKEYRALLDQFYQKREMHFEMLEYDRKINLQEKERLIEEAQKLIPTTEDELNNSEEWRKRLDHMTELQQQWRATGHVPREEMERINNTYRETLDVFFDLRQKFLDKQDEIREQNGTKKQAILEQMATFSAFNSEKPRQWNEATNQLRAFQQEWQKLGPAPQKINGELWHKYREICNAFFSNKSGFFKKLDEVRNQNLEQKRALCEKAEALKESKEWEKSAKELKALQKEWKQIGPVPERYSNKLWNRFRAACDAFFEARRSHYQTLHSEEHENLQKKKTLIEEVKKLLEDEEVTKEAGIQRIKELQAEWKEIGKVPFKEKDKIWDEFRANIDKFFNGLRMRKEELNEVKLRASLNMIENTEKRSRHIKTQISRIRKKISMAKEKAEQYGTNIMFISKGKSGDKLRKQIQDEIDKLNQYIADMKKKVKVLEEAMKNPPKGDEDAATIDALKTANAPEEQESEATEETAKDAEASEPKASAEEPVAEEAKPEAEEEPVEEAKPEAENQEEDKKEE